MASPTSSMRVERLFEAFKDEGALLEECQKVASDIKNGMIKLLAFVEELGPFLTNKDTSQRANGTAALSSVLTNLPKDFLNETELNFITTFLCDRLKDHHSVTPSVLRGILAIVRMEHLPQDAPSRLFTVMFQHVHCQSQLQPDRRNIYLIFQTLLQSRANDLRAMGPDFVYGVISALDGERDPRNLMLLFKVLPQFIEGFPLGHLTEEMFEVIACYFPVDFNASSVEGQSVTRDDLAHSLAPCLYAIPEFAEYCVPLIIEKLDSSLRLAKLDSLNLLRDGAMTFGAEGLGPYLDELWPVLRKEVVPGGDTEVKNAGLETVTALVRALSEDDSVRVSFIEKVLTATKSSLCDVQLSLFWSAEKLLEAVARANEKSCIQVLKVVVPLFLGQYSTKSSVSDKVTLLDSLNNFLTLCADHGFTVKSVPKLAWTDIPTLYLNTLVTEDTELRAKAFLGLTIQKSSLSESNRIQLYERVCSEIEAGNNGTKCICHSCLLAFAKTYPHEILDHVTKQLDISTDVEDTVVLSRRLDALSAIVGVPELGLVILPKMVSLSTSRNLENSLAALSYLRRLVSMRNNGFDIHSFLHKECNAIHVLVSSDTNNSNQRLALISSICRSIVRKLDTEGQQSIVNEYTTAFGESLSESNVVLLEGLLTPLRKTVSIQNTDTLLTNLYNLALRSTNGEAKRVSAKLISVLINKMTEGECLGRILNVFREQIKEILESDASDYEMKKAAVVLHTWITKATVTRGSSGSQDILDYQTYMLRNTQVGNEAAEGFKVLVDKFEDTLTEENFCNIRIFYKQRIFQNLLQKNNFEGDSRQNYLCAVTHLVEEVPMELLFRHLSELVPLLIESLALDNAQHILSTLVILKPLLETKNEAFSEQVQYFIPRFLCLVQHKQMKVRIAALECLLSYSTYPTIMILPFKQDVLENLATAIDDKKRLVRKIAVKTRTRWYLVGAPGEPK